MAREVLSNGVINPDKYQADWYADLSNNWNLLNDLIGSAISGSEVDSKIATAIQELMVRTFQIVAELPETGTEGVMYLVAIPNTSKYTAYVWENSAYRELGVIQMTITIDDELSTTSENPAQNKVITNALNNKANSSHTHSASDITSGLATVATSGSYNDLSNKPTIPTVNNATLTIQKNGTTVDTFTANSSSDKTVNIQCVDLTSNQTVAGNKEFTGTTTAHDVVPSANSALGTSTNKWKSFNGLNPGALSLPSTLLSAMIQIDTTSWVLDGETDVEYTPLGDGYLTLANNQNLEWVKGQIQNDNYFGIYRFTYKYDSVLGGIQGVTIPCIRGKKVVMKIKGTGFYNALFTYCQGNV